MRRGGRAPGRHSYSEREGRARESRVSRDAGSPSAWTRGRRWRGLVAVLVGAVLLGGCASSGLKPAAGNRRTITLTWLIKTGYLGAKPTWYKEAIAGFEQLHPNVRIHFLSAPQSGYNAKLLTMVASGDPPDVFGNFAAGFGTFLAKGVLGNIQPYIKAHKVNVHQWDGSAIAALQRGGRLYGLPIANSPVVLIYNRTLFDRAHVSLPPTAWNDPAWTIAAMAQNAKKLTAHATNPARAVWGINFGIGQFGTQAAWLWGCDPFAGHGGPTHATAYRTGIVRQSYFTSACYTQALSWATGLSTRAHVAPVPEDMSVLSTLGDPFLSGRIAMETFYTATLGSFATVKPPFRWGIAAIPRGPGGNRTTVFTDAWLMSAKSRHPRTAFEFMLYLTTGAPERRVSASSGFFPALKSLEPSAAAVYAKLPGATQSARTILAVISAAKKDSFQAPGHTLNNAIALMTSYSNLTDQMLAGQQSVKAALAGVEKSFGAHGSGG